MGKDRIHIGNLGVWLRDQVRHPSTLFQRKTWGVFSVYSHVRRSDRLPKKSEQTREKALDVADFMKKKYGGSYSIYKCLFCDGWHVAKDQNKTVSLSGKAHELTADIIGGSTETSTNISRQGKYSELDMVRLLNLDIPDITATYGGIRGRTMSSRHQNFAWPTIKECGIRTIIDLREDGVYTRLRELCSHFGIEYFYYPVDNKAQHIDEMVRLFPDLCRKIDTGRFYIACAMGLHRTDIALCCYWVFHAADRGLPPPEIRGYRKAKGHDIDKIMRVLNAFYRCLSERNRQPPFSQDTFNQRKRTITNQAYK